MRVDLTEHSPPAEVSLPTEIVLALAATRLVDAVPVPGTRRWSLKARSKVGAVGVGDVEVHVAPKIDIDRVVYLLAYGHGRVDWRQESVDLAQALELLVAVVEAFERTTSKALLQGYWSVDEALTVVRGRIREAG